jgi:hypothetical protein
MATTAPAPSRIILAPSPRITFLPPIAKGGRARPQDPPEDLLRQVRSDTAATKDQEGLETPFQQNAMGAGAPLVMLFYPGERA